MLVERRGSGRLGSNPAAPLVAGRRSSQEKMPWREVPTLEGTVESRFIHPVLLGESILPYRLFRTFEGVIPVTSSGRLLDATAARDAGENKLAAWMEGAEAAWDAHGRGKRRFVEQLDYIGQLSSQFPIAPARVVYAKAGALPAAMIVRDQQFVIDHMLYWTKVVSEDEAGYLVVVLNSEFSRAHAERHQARGQFGARHFDKAMFNLPIPVFNGKDTLHRDLADAGQQAERVAGRVSLPEGERFQRARKRVRDALAEDGIGGEIEILVGKLLGASALA